MTDDERDRIARAAKEEEKLAGRVSASERDTQSLTTRVVALEKKIESFVTWVFRAIFGAIAYLMTQIITYFANGGMPK
jgi:hypothetical protein